MNDAARAERARALCRAFAGSLQDLQRRWGVEYVRVGSPATSRTLERHVEHPPANDRGTTASADRVARPAGLRTQAEQWSSERKLEYLQKKNIGDCRRCALSQGRRHIVFGVGNPDAALMFVGEAPGADEDACGEPFVGRAGQRLDRWIEAIGLRREDVYIANVLKCRPPNNRDPRPDEVDKCSPFLKAQIRAITPKVIVALGRHAGMLLSSREDLSLRAMRMARLTYDASAPNEPPGTRPTPLIVTYHPAYVLRQEGSDASSGKVSAEATVLDDLRRAVEMTRSS